MSTSSTQDIKKDGWYEYDDKDDDDDYDVNTDDDDDEDDNDENEDLNKKECNGKQKKFKSRTTTE